MSPADDGEMNLESTDLLAMLVIKRKSNALEVVAPARNEDS